MPVVTILPQKQAIEIPCGSALVDLDCTFESEPIAFGCRVGSCGMCVIEIVSSEAPLEAGDEDERAFLHDLGFHPDRHRLACRMRVHADMAVRAYDDAS
jgi:ferredoxin